jgi:hypothetical protein
LAKRSPVIRINITSHSSSITTTIQSLPIQNQTRELNSDEPKKTSEFFKFTTTRVFEAMVSADPARAIVLATVGLPLAFVIDLVLLILALVLGIPIGIFYGLWKAVTMPLHLQPMSN